ncbi:hypothetical protein B8W72_13160 [Pseudomonas putida]|uniref:Peptidoglycan binding-like domain-containing protein n=2 Tax=Pseudomonas putida TaxID=303 RepID=A0A1Y3L6L9_PSEPU|nr:hypothetical protein B8W72_13160 [Pseudomonas putida]
MQRPCNTTGGWWWNGTAKAMRLVMTRFSKGVVLMQGVCLVVLALCANLSSAAPHVPYGLPEESQPAAPGMQLVTQLQVALSELRLYQGEIDGLIGARTQEALYLLQMAHELPLTGSVNLPTLKVLGIAPPHWMQH